MASGSTSTEATGVPRYPRPVAATTPETYLADLNPAQREAVLHTEGPVLSGMLRRVRHLVNVEEKQ